MNLKRLIPILLLLAAPSATNAQEADIDIPFEKFTLDNGLTVIVHEDHKAPIVAVNVWYHVGSKNEPPGKTGFAHLFEHLMFNGSEHFNDDYFQMLERIGATDLNGTTNADRTNYFQTVPVGALDVALWMESDRMGYMLGAITQEKLDEQRGVVQNEKREGENQPYGRVYTLIREATYPAGHPYAHTTIGSMEDLDAATLEDVHEWFKTYYGPNNAVLAIAGDIDVETARAKVEQYFGEIPPGPPIAKHDVWIAKRTGEQRQILEDRVSQARLYMVWNIPPTLSTEFHYLEMVGGVLSSGKTSRLYKRLVYDDQIATDVSAYAANGEIGGQFNIVATARPGQELGPIEQAIREELDRFLAEGPTQEELERIKIQTRASFIRGIERVGGFGGKSDILAQSEVYGGSPDAYKKRLHDIANATTADLQREAQEWLSDGVYVLEVRPFTEGKALAQGADRTKAPEPAPQPESRFPTFERATLSNGMKVLLASRDAVPVVNFTLVVDAGYAADQFAAPGLTSLAMNMLDEGTTSRTSLEISDEARRLGANISTGSNLDFSNVSLSAIKDQLEPSLDLFADIILNPSFPEADFNRLKQEQIARIQQERVTPIQMALRVFPRLLYGEGHAYALPLTGSGTEADVQAISRDDLVAFHRTWFRPNNAMMVVVGDITMDELKPLLETRFGSWKQGDVPKKNLATVEHRPQAVYLIDRPGSPQSVIFAGHVAPPPADPDEAALLTMNEILGGAFTSRINMNLREDKHWSYGASSFFYYARAQRPFIAYTSVQSDKTKESMIEIAKELREIRRERPVTQKELDQAKRGMTLSLPGRWETNSSVMSSLIEMAFYGLPDDYYDTYGQRINALDIEDITAAANRVIHPDNVVWVVVGDRASIEQGIRELGFGDVHLIDTEGKPLQSAGM